MSSHSRLQPVLVISASLGVILAASLFAAGLIALLQARETSNPTSTPLALATRTPRPAQAPDPRIAQLVLLGIHLVDQKCAAPCTTTIIPYVALGDFIERLGPPEKVYSQLIGPNYDVTLVYAKKGFLAFAFRLANDDVVNMTPDMAVTNIHLLNARSLEDLERELKVVSGVEIPLAKAQDWTGFGAVRQLGR